MTTKRLSKQQIIVLMGANNISKFMFSLEDHIANINRALKNIKSEIMADFLYYNYQGLIITTNKTAFQLDLSTIEKYIKNIDFIKTEDIMASCLLQSKSYLTIIGIPYIKENTNSPINFTNIKKIIQFTHIFNNVYLVSKLHIIKSSPKYNMVVV